MVRAEVLQGVRQMRFEGLLERHERGELSQQEAAEMLGVSERTGIEAGKATPGGVVESQRKAASATAQTNAETSPDNVCREPQNPAAEGKGFEAPVTVTSIDHWLDAATRVMYRRRLANYPVQT
jgi:transposase